MHGFPSEQGVPLPTGAWLQPLESVQESAVQTLPSSQPTGVCVHVPDPHASAVHALVSLQSAHAEPDAPQLPVAVPDVQKPPEEQQLAPVQHVVVEPQHVPGAPSLQVAPALPAGCWQVVVTPSQTSAVQGFASSVQLEP